MSRLRSFVLSLVALVVPCTSLAAVVEGGVVSTDTIWEAAQAPYELFEELEVAEDVTLTIEPGVEVQLGQGVSLVVRGTIVAMGTAQSPITFTRHPSLGEVGSWGSVVVTDEARDAVIEELAAYGGGSVFSHAVFQHGSQALRLEGSAPLVADCVFAHNHMMGTGANMGGAALAVLSGASPLVIGCRFEDNETTGIEGQGGAMLVSFADPIIKDCHFEGNSCIYGGALTTIGMLSPIVGSTFVDNVADFEGGAMSLVSSSPAIIGTTVQGNYSPMDGGGIHVCVDCYPHANPTVLDCTIVDNEVGFEGAAGIGAAYLRGMHGTSLHGNLMGDAPADFAWHNELGEVYPSWVMDPDISYNWWGTTDLEAITATIHDGLDEEGLGIASFEPILEAPPSSPPPRVVVTTQKLRYQHQHETMPVVLTVYNPGAPRALEVLVTVQYDALPPLPLPVAVELPEGAVTPAGSVRFFMPEDTVAFGTVVAPSYDEERALALGEGVFSATLYDGETGEALGEPSVARFLVGLGPNDPSAEEVE